MTTHRLRTLTAALSCLTFAAATTATAQQLRTNCFNGCWDNWISFQDNTDNSGLWEYQPRLYHPFRLPGGWTFTQRIDLPVSLTDQVGTDNSAGVWKVGLGDWFIEEIFSTPKLARHLTLWASVRFVFPTGGSSPFSSSLYQWAPALSATLELPGHVTFTPVARYVLSFQSSQAGAGTIRQLTLYPILTLALPHRWSVALYPENAIVYNDVSHNWFVPVDLMVIKRLSKTVELGLGAAYALVKDDPLYQHIIYGRLTLYL